MTMNTVDDAAVHDEWGQLEERVGRLEAKLAEIIRLLRGAGHWPPAGRLSDEVVVDA